MQPVKPLNIYTVRAYGPGGEKKKISFLSNNEFNATRYYKRFYANTEYEKWSLIATKIMCGNSPITELHCLHYGTRFQLVHKGCINADFDCDEHKVKSLVLTKCDYNPINRTYLCLDGDGNKYYIDAYEWCITEEEK